MTETAQEYTARMLRLSAGQDPYKVLAATPAKLRRLLSGQSARALARPAAPGKWSVRQILAHLADGEIVMAYRMRLILSKSGTEIQAFDQDAWATDGDYGKVDPALSLAAIEGLRKLTLGLLKRLTAAERARYGIHQERGKESLDHIARMMAGHDLNHLGQIAGILKKSAASGRRD